MKILSVQAFARSRYPLAILAGFLLACAFPKFGIAGFGWIAPGAILAVALGASGKQSFRLGYAAGLTHFLVSLYWLLCIPVRGFPILGWIALSAFLALYPATWTWLAIRAFPKILKTCRPRIRRQRRRAGLSERFGLYPALRCGSRGR